MSNNGKAQRQRGDRAEREIVNALKEKGIDACRVPLSGAAKGEFGGDLRVAGLTAEVKSRKGGGGFSLLMRWIEAVDLLFVKSGPEILVVMPLDLFKDLIALKGKKTDGPET